ncbi:LysR family transcriptional regulator [Bradyrhizobium sp.]|uniref:LysR family transcriptional regulator n=1 Tax=Bradyrhizobium sp. TaxID=376 RepID=UPI003C5B8A6B
MRYLPEIEAVRSFRLVAEELNFRRAAEKLGIDHSALSRRIRDLEHRLGFALFDRTTREVRVTDAGKVFLEENRTLLRSLQRSVDNARLVAEGMAGRISVGYMSFAAARLLPEAIARFKALRPNTRFELTYLRSHAQKEALARGDIDVALMLGPWQNDFFETIPISREPLCVYFRRGHAAFEAGPVPTASLSAEALIMGSLEEWDTYRWGLDDLFFRKGVTPNVTLEASSISGILGLVQAGLGCTIFPESVAAQCPPDIHHQIIADSDVDVETIGVALRRPSPIVREFMTILRTEFAEANGR